jgi:signal transduction histidine kinase/ActR/RegA family two-component response regulator
MGSYTTQCSDSSVDVGSYARIDYQLLFQKLPGLMLVILPDKSFTILAMTEAFERNTPKSAKDVIGRGLFESYPEDPHDDNANGAKALRESLHRVLASKTTDVIPIQRYSVEYEKDRYHVTFWSVENSPVLDDDGRVSYIIHTVQNITDWVKSKNLEQVVDYNKIRLNETKNDIEVFFKAQQLQRDNDNLRSSRQEVLENERENFRNLFRQTPEMVCMLYGPEHVFEFVNQAHILALGFDATGMSVRQAQPESVEVHGILDTVYQTGVTAELREIPVTVGKWLRYFNLTYSARRDSDGTINGVMILGSEITQQIAAREAIQRAKDISDTANASKTNFVANMSHEIRTPIGIIIGFCEILLEDSMPEGERREYLHRVIRNAKSLTRIVDDILDLAKVEAGKLELEASQFSLMDLVKEVVDSLSERARDKGIYLNVVQETFIPELLQSDALRLRQILVNIIGNAVKFTSVGGVTVRLSFIQDDVSSQFTIKVTDTGVGLNFAQIERLFKPFVQADDSTSRTFGGTGLGLVISLRLAQALGGDIEVVEYAEGLGCTFVIRFQDGIAPRGRKVIHPEGETRSIEQANRLDGIKILLAEDSIDNQVLVKRILTRSGASVAIVENGIDAVDFATRSDASFDLVLMDVQMPKMDGYEATRSLRKAGYSKPIIALTAHAMTNELEKTLEAGCNAHLTKPINSHDLIATIRAHFGR